MDTAPEAHISKNITQVITIGLQMFKMMQIMMKEKLEQERAELHKNIQEGKEWLAVNNGVLKSQIELSDNEIVKEKMNEEDYANLHAVSHVNSTNEHLSPEDRMFYQEAKSRLSYEAKKKFGVDLSDVTNTSYPQANIKDLANDDQATTVDLAKSPEAASSEAAINPEDEKIYTTEQTNSPLGQANSEVLEKSQTIAPEVEIPTPKQVQVPKLTR